MPNLPYGKANDVSLTSSKDNIFPTAPAEFDVNQFQTAPSAAPILWSQTPHGYSLYKHCSSALAPVESNQGDTIDMTSSPAGTECVVNQGANEIPFFTLTQVQ